MISTNSFAKFALLTIGAITSFSTLAQVQRFDWSEELKLSTGQVVTVERFEEYRRHTDVGAGFKTGLLFLRAGISASFPTEGQTILFEGSLEPLALDLDSNGIAYLVCDVATGASRNEWRVPRGEFYVAFLYKEGRLSRIPLSSLPPSVTPNLAPYVGISIEKGNWSGKHIDLRAKQELVNLLPPNDRLRVLVRPSKR